MVRDDWNGFNLLHTAASRVGALELEFFPAKGGMSLDDMTGGKLDVLYLLGADELPFEKMKNTFIIYQGHHGDAGAAHADVILPGAAYTEKNATYVNTEGRAQLARQAVFPPGEAKEDWKIMRALSDKLGKTLPYDTLVQVRARLAEVNPLFSQIDTVTSATWRPFGKEGKIEKTPFGVTVPDFYQTNVICRSSKVMADCTAAFVSEAEEKAVANG